MAQRVPQHEDALMTIAQQLEQQGIEKVIQPGGQEGRSEDEREATLKIPLPCCRTALTIIP